MKARKTAPRDNWWNQQVNDKFETCRRGEHRFGAGRQRKTWEEDTILMRIPRSQVEEVIALLKQTKPTEML